MPDQEQPDGRGPRGQDSTGTPTPAGAAAAAAPRPATAAATPAATPAVPRRPHTPQTKEPAHECPTCGGPLDRYTGGNPFKQDTGWCQGCGVRRRLPVPVGR